MTKPLFAPYWTALLGLVIALGVANVVAIAPTAASSTDNPARVCDSDARNGGPATPPEGAVVVPAGNNANVDFARANTTYWFATGVHTLGSSEWGQIAPADNSTFIGAPGAILDGENVNRYAFTQRARDVTIKYLTIRNFVAPRDEGVVNHDSGNGWTIAHSTLTLNKGAAMMAGAGQQMIGNCLKDNGQYGLNAYQAGNKITNLVLEGNEFVGNNTDDWESRVDGCGCTGAMKFWSVDGADIRDNWIHDNRGPGIWADTNNNDFLIENNLIESNDGQAVFYEISYNAVIRDNVLRDNTWVAGREFANRRDNFPIGTIYVSEAGGDPRVPARTTLLEITGNVFDNNWGGVAGWENADRFCGTNTTSECTLLVGEDNESKCVQPGIASEPLYSDCRWKTQRLRVHHNEFKIDTAEVGCSTAYCGLNALFANHGTWPDWSPYKGRKIQEAITFAQDNRWHDNTYIGPWRWVAYEPGRYLTFAQWQADPYNQDAGSS
ncbi:MAG: right-handed parallel beta-helix repeat-containing protein [Haloechinothrix sp.]